MNLDDIHFHDCTLNHVVEDTLADTLSFEVSYPIDWQKNIFAPRTIQFSAYQNYEVHGISFQGPPTLLEVAQWIVRLTIKRFASKQMQDIEYCPTEMLSYCRRARKSFGRV